MSNFKIVESKATAPSNAVPMTVKTFRIDSETPAPTPAHQKLLPLKPFSTLVAWALAFATASDDDEPHDIAAIAANCARMGVVTSGANLTYNVTNLIEYAHAATTRTYRNLPLQKADTKRSQWRELFNLLCHIQAAAKPIL